MKTLTKEDKAVKTPKYDLMVEALKHYEEASAAVHHWNSDIPKAIIKYYSDQQTTRLTAINEKQAELDKLRKSYITFIGEQLSDNAMFLKVHGISCSEKDVQIGAEYRKQLNQLESELQSLQAGEEKEEPYFCIESTLNNCPVWWSGLTPHLSQDDSDSQIDMWVTDIHKAKKYKVPIDASNDNQRFQINGIITEHLDIQSLP